MMKVEKIYTDRRWRSKVFFDLVYEWEDSLVQDLKVDFFFGKKLFDFKYFRFVPQLGLLFFPKEKTLQFNLSAFRRAHYNVSSLIPVIVDFFIRDAKALTRFYKNYSKAPVVLITSKEAYDFLAKNNCPLNIKHWPLSLSDIYRINDKSHYEKKYDMVLMGRQNPVLQKFVERYSITHTSFCYVYRERGTFDYFSSRGEKIGNLGSREEYLNVMRNARVGLYATPGIDGGETRTHGFNQVTPRFLEYLACGCHIIARYPKNSDTDFYELEKFCPSIETYEQFETALDRALSTDVDMKAYSEYLSKHYTSVRTNQLLEILEEF